MNPCPAGYISPLIVSCLGTAWAAVCISPQCGTPHDVLGGNGTRAAAETAAEDPARQGGRVTSTRNTGALADWMRRGACIDRPYLLEGAVTTALALCGGCPVRVDCLEWVLGLPEAEDPDHVCAGLTARQRGALRKERAAPKWCAGCEQELPAARFDRHARALDGLRSRCKDCECARQKAHRAAKRGEVMA